MSGSVVFVSNLGLRLVPIMGKQVHSSVVANEVEIIPIISGIEVEHKAWPVRRTTKLPPQIAFLLKQRDQVRGEGVAQRKYAATIGFPSGFMEPGRRLIDLIINVGKEQLGLPEGRLRGIACIVGEKPPSPNNPLSTVLVHYGLEGAARGMSEDLPMMYHPEQILLYDFDNYIRGRFNFAEVQNQIPNRERMNLSYGSQGVDYWGHRFLASVREFTDNLERALNLQL